MYPWGLSFDAADEVFVEALEARPSPGAGRWSQAYLSLHSRGATRPSFRWRLWWGFAKYAAVRSALRPCPAARNRGQSNYRRPLLIRIDDIVAALILSLSMLRRLETKHADASSNPGVLPADFEHWRALALRASNQAGVACLLKVVLSISWFLWAPGHVGQQVFQLVGLLLFVAWVVALVWAWQISTDAHHLRRRLGIELRRRSEAPKEGDPPRPSER
jgi:hypothetical protein